ncbi:DNA alkylation repair protein [Hoylesella buccalis]|uniref:Peptidase n=1 Tax=Hoylesella buccalis DNF00853 TaxID=1401074 RepID=A0A095ZRT5_9BACT|nr:DNA alkylation repair protein [Hoylesella buccalis]KGF37121.1 peptidase [Hoylesella buccalis DNF00853]
MNEDVNETVKEIKRSFRLLMNGVASQSMRQKGVDYKINWGVSLPDLQKMAQQYGKNLELAVALWQENVRECKILATLIMPPGEMDETLAEKWIGEIYSQDLAEMACFNLFQYLYHAADLSYQLMKSNREVEQMCGYLVLSRLFMKGENPHGNRINEFIDDVAHALNSENMGVRHAALNCVNKFAELGEDFRNMAENRLNLLL